MWCGGVGKVRNEPGFWLLSKKCFYSQLGRSPGEGKGYPLQYSGLENSMGSIVHGVTQSRTRQRWNSLSSPNTLIKIEIFPVPGGSPSGPSSVSSILSPRHCHHGSLCHHGCLYPSLTWRWMGSDRACSAASSFVRECVRFMRGVACSIFPSVFIMTAVLSRFSRAQLCATLWTVGTPSPTLTPLSMGFSRQEKWSRLPCPPPGDRPNPGIEPTSPVFSCIGRLVLSLLAPPGLLFIGNIL